MTRPKTTCDRIGVAITAVTNCIAAPLSDDINIQLCRGQNVIMLPGMILPYEQRTYRYWTPARYAVLWNDYVTWIEEGRGSKKEFCMQYAARINAGLIPIFRLDAADSSKLEEGFMTWQAIQSQIDVFFAEENQALIKNSDGTVTCNPSALAAMTYREKIESAQKSHAKAKDSANSATATSSEFAVHLEGTLETKVSATESLKSDSADSKDSDALESFDLATEVHSFGHRLRLMNMEFTSLVAKLNKFYDSEEPSPSIE